MFSFLPGVFCSFFFSFFRFGHGRCLAPVPKLIISSIIIISLPSTFRSSDVNHWYVQMKRGLWVGDESPIPPALWPSIGMTQKSAGTSSIRSVKPKRELQLQLVRKLHHSESSHVQRYVPENGLVRKSVYETRQRSEVWRKRKNV